jgi:hypothetical protein
MNKNRKEKKAAPKWDDGRVIAPMNVEGLPYYQKNKRKETEEQTTESEKTPITREESRIITGAALRAALLIGGVFVAVFGLFFLFMQFVWLR